MMRPVVEDLRRYGWWAADVEYRRLGRLADERHPATLALLGTLDGDRSACVSPLHLLAIGVPLAVVHSDADEVVPIADAETFTLAALAAGDEVYDVIVEGDTHRCALMPTSATRRSAKQALRGLMEPSWA